MSRKSWNKQEDKSLLKLAKENKERDWNTIAMRLKSNRTPVQCLQRYQTALNTEHVKREWSGDDDEKLREAVARCGVGNWQEVSNTTYTCVMYYTWRICRLLTLWETAIQEPSV